MTPVGGSSWKCAVVKVHLMCSREIRPRKFSVERLAVVGFIGFAGRVKFQLSLAQEAGLCKQKLQFRDFSWIIPHGKTFSLLRLLLGVVSSRDTRRCFEASIQFTCHLPNAILQSISNDPWKSFLPREL